ncbi:MAG: hypothetical protein CMC70_01430 [Flavobacteriaceae bacterium]|nr:hypothetical protein [Flavobacteriaceae bacterium]
MNVLQRKMFRSGGEAFPDLSGDGKVTKKDILMGRGVLPRNMQMGGIADAMPAAPSPMPAAPSPMSAEQELMAAQAQGEQVGIMAGERAMGMIDQAQDYETLINGIRGDNLPIGERYAELAEYVGPQDAQQTPESVLALTQPAIVMAESGQMDQGIGELMGALPAADVDMQGPMQEGVGALMAQGAGNTPPVNFNQGGPVEVRGYQGAGEVSLSGGQPLSPVLTQAMRDAPSYQKFFASVLDKEARAEDLEEQRRMAKAQMLFDIAQTGLQFAGTTEGGSIAERLANAAAQTQLPQRIGERAAGIMAAKREQRSEDRQMRMAGAQASLEQAISDQAAADALALKAAGKTDRETKPQSLFKLTTDKNGQTGLEKIGVYDLNDKDPASKTGFVAYNTNFQTGGVLDEEGAKDFRSRLFNESGVKREVSVALTDGVDSTGKKIQKGDILTGTPREMRAIYEGISYAPVSANDLNSFTQLFRVRYDDLGFAVPETKSVIKLDAVRNIENYQSEGFSTDRAVYDQAIATNARLDEAGEKVKIIKIVRRTPDGDFETLNYNTFEDPRGAARKVTEKMAQPTEEGYGPWELAEDSIAFGNAIAAAKERAVVMARQEVEGQADLVEIGLSAPITVGDKTFTPNERGVLTVSRSDLQAIYNSPNFSTVQIELEPNLDINNKFDLLDFIESNVEAYAAGNLENESNFESRVLLYTQKKKSFDSETGVKTVSGPKLSPKAETLIKDKNPELYYQMTGKLPPRELPEGQDFYPLPEAKNELFDSQGKLIRDHPSFENAPTTFYDEGVKYRAVIGASRLIPQIRAAISEGAAEILDPEGTSVASEEAENLKQAVSDLDSMSIVLNQFLTSQRDERVLKSVQDEINAFLSKIKPGGVFFRNDAQAAGAFEALAKQIALQIETDKELLPDYGGKEAAFFGAPAQQKARLRIIKMKPLIVELTRFRDHFKGGSEDGTSISITSEDKKAVTQSAAEAVRNILGR